MLRFLGAADTMIERNPKRELSSAQALLWQKKGFSIQEARTYIQEGFSTDEAIVMRDYNLTIAEVRGLIDDAAELDIEDED